MPRLPIPGADDNVWGTLLNDFLIVAHHEDGSARGCCAVVNVRDYGATGDGVTDDSVAIQTTIDEAPEGSVICLPKGTYAITVPVRIWKSATFAGAGPATTIKFKDGATILGIHQSLLSVIPAQASLENVVITNLQLDGNRDHTTQLTDYGGGNWQPGEWNPGIDVATKEPFLVSRVWIREVFIKNVQGDGIIVQGSYAPTIRPQDVYITNNAIENWKDNRQGIAVTNGNRVTLHGNHLFNHCGFGYGIDLETHGNLGEVVTNVDVSGNVITSQNGIAVGNIPPSTISGILLQGNLVNVTGQRVVVGPYAQVADYGNRIADGSVFLPQKVGIGVPSPDASLDLSGDIKLGQTPVGTTGFRIWNEPADGIRLQAGNADNGVGICVGGALGFIIDADNNGVGADYMWFRGSGSSAQEWMRLQNGNLGIGVPNPSYQLQLSQDSAAKPVSNTWTIASDARLKENIRPFTDGLSVLEAIDPVCYTLNGKAGMTKGLQGIGVIAQDVKETIPYTISTFKGRLNPDDSQETELYSFDSSALTFVLINAVNELRQRVQQLERQLAARDQRGLGAEVRPDARERFISG